MRAIICLFLTATLILLAAPAPSCASTPQDVGLSFNETMAGFYAFGDMDFQQAYNKGKQLGQSISFTCHVSIPHMRAFVNDSQHVSNIDGIISIANFTKPGGSAVRGGTLKLFNGTVFDHELHMYYFLPFVGVDGQQYHLDGVKHIRGDNCTFLFYMSTTLFSTIRTGTIPGQGRVVATAIAQIDLIGVLALVASFRFIGNGTDADKLDTVAEFAMFLLRDVSSDCLNTTNWETQFWYIWGSDGDAGFLLDLIARPSELELRLATYGNGMAPQMHKQYLPLEALKVDNTAVQFSDAMTMTDTSCIGSVLNISLDTRYALNIGMNDFVPPVLWSALHGMVPQIESKYGRLSSGTVMNHVYAPATPLVHTTYTFQMWLPVMQWVMISAMEFVDPKGVASDLRVELVGMRAAKGFILGSAFVTYASKEYHLNDPATSETKWTTPGTLVNATTRMFAATIRDHKALALNITCAANVGSFATLEQEGSTMIQTTVLGSCSVAMQGVPGLFRCANTALLETKHAASTPLHDDERESDGAESHPTV